MSGGTTPPRRASPWSALTALPLSLVLPWRACGGAWRGMGPIGSLPGHIAGLLIFGVGLIVFDATLWYGDLIYEIDSLVSEGPAIALIVGAAWLAGIELLYLFTAWLTVCWGARIEPLRSSMGRSLARWYQLTPFHAVWTLGFMFCLHLIEQLDMSYWDGSYTVGSESMELLISLLYPLSTAVYFGVGGWVTLVVLAIHRDGRGWPADCRWPAGCEGCGYALAGLTRDQSCPECGMPVERSLYAPRGTLPRGTLGLLRLAAFQPSDLGRHLLTRTRTPGPVRALALTAVLLLASGPVGMVYLIMVSELFTDEGWVYDGYGLLRTLVIGGLGVGITCMSVGVLSMLGAGSLVGTLERLFGKRHLMTAASQAACYSGGWVVGWMLAMIGVSGMLMVVGSQFAKAQRYDLLTLLPMVWITAFSAIGLLYVIVVWRIVRGARYANV